MAGKIAKAAREAGMPEREFVPKVIEEEGSIHKAALRMRVYPQAINWWLRRNNMRVETKQVARVITSDA